MPEDLPAILARLEKDAGLAKGLIERVREKVNDSLTVMEVCGTHTHAISKTGIRRALADKVKLLSGPGCPVCVTPDGEIDRFIELSRTPGVVVTTFGDMLHVPGSESSLAFERDAGRKIRIVYSPLDVLEMARAQKDREFVFLGVGFETTAPAILATVMQAREMGIRNFSIYASFKLIPPALRMIAEHPELNLAGFLLPGHVSAIIGSRPYRFLVDGFSMPSVIAGFEATDILQALAMIADQIDQNQPRLDIQYKRVVTPEGNRQALRLMQEMCDVKDSVWRGLGKISQSSLKLNKDWKAYDVEAKLNLAPPESKDSARAKGCRCGEVLLGSIIPPDCPLFARGCTPSNPIGPCMVSSEGACSAYYKYER